MTEERRICNVPDCPNVAKKKQLKCNRHCQSPETYAARKRREKGLEYRLHKKNYCESKTCMWNGEFIPHQLHVDHADGNKKNNDISNLVTLCANCHSLKTWENQEFKKPHQRGKSVVVDTTIVIQ